MADQKKHGDEVGTEKRVREVDEVQSFSGGDVKSVEPVAEVHEELHYYAGGEFTEHTSTVISPWLWAFYAFVLVVVALMILFFLAPGFFNPAMRGVSGREAGYGGVFAPAGGIGNYNSLNGEMQTQMANESLASPALIDMYRLPLPAGQTLKQGIAAGTDVYTTYCIGCHGPNQDGNGPNSVSLDPKPRNLRDEPFMQALSYQRIWTSVHKGVPGTAMPRWENTLSNAQIEDVIAYVLSITAPQDPTTHDFIRPSQADIAGASAGTPTPLPAPR